MKRELQSKKCTLTVTTGSTSSVAQFILNSSVFSMSPDCFRSQRKRESFAITLKSMKFWWSWGSLPAPQSKAKESYKAWQLWTWIRVVCQWRTHKPMDFANWPPKSAPTITLKSWVIYLLQMRRWLSQLFGLSSKVSLTRKHEEKLKSSVQITCPQLSNTWTEKTSHLSWAVTATVKEGASTLI